MIQYVQKKTIENGDLLIYAKIFIDKDSCTNREIEKMSTSLDMTKRWVQNLHYWTVQFTKVLVKGVMPYVYGFWEACVVTLIAGRRPILMGNEELHWICSVIPCHIGKYIKTKGAMRNAIQHYGAKLNRTILYHEQWYMQKYLLIKDSCTNTFVNWTVQ